MKTLIVAPFLDGTGYGKAAEAVAEALSLKTDVACHALKLNQSQYLPSKTVQDLLKKEFLPDVVLQIYTPNFFVGPGIGWWFQESRNQGTAAGWRRNASCVEEWVSGPFDAAKRMVVPTDLSKYNKEYPQPLPKSKNFRFYYIGDIGRRKNLTGLIKAWILAFQRQPVELILKVGPQSVPIVKQMVEDIVNGAQVNPRYIGQIIIEGREFTDEEIYGLHQQCDCFITTSHGEGWCLPAIDALGFGKLTILPSYFARIGSSRFNPFGQSSRQIDSREIPCWFADSMPTIYNAGERWFDVDVLSTIEKMQDAFINRSQETVDIQHLSYDTAGQEILEALNDYRERNS